MRSIRGPGFSLAETIISLGMFTVALLAVGLLLTRSQQLLVQNDVKITAQRSLLKLNRQLTLVFDNAPASSVTLAYAAGNQADLIVGMLSARTEAGETITEPGTSLPVYQGYWVYYRQPATRQLKALWKPLATPSTSAPPLTQSELTTLAASGAGHAVVADCESFQARQLADGTLLAAPANPMRFDVGVKTGRGDVLESDFPVRNRF